MEEALPRLGRLRPGAQALRRARRAKGADYPKRPLGPTSITRPCGLYYGMITPLQPYAIKGVIWYQGEANGNTYKRSIEYRKLFPALIQCWREDWSLPDLPFLFVQLANTGRPPAEPEENQWGYLREAQTMALSLPNTGMAVASDDIEGGIHPARKEPIGQRLAQWAKHSVYGRDVIPSGQMFDSMRIEGNKVVLKFKYAGSGLVPTDRTVAGHQMSSDALKGFSICGDNRKFVWANATIVGKDTVVVESPEVAEPVEVRFAWVRFPLFNLYNKEGFPAVPFRTDSFDPPADK